MHCAINTRLIWFLLKLAFRNVFRQKLRTGITLVTITFCVAGLVLSGGFVQDVYYQLGEAIIHSQSGHLQISKVGFHDKGMHSPEKFLLDQPSVIKQELLDQPQVDVVMERINFSGLISNGRSDWPIVGEGVEPDKEATLGTYIRIIEGRQLISDDTFGILLGEGVAQALKLRAGDNAILLLNTAEGALNSLEFEVIGIFQSFSKDYDARAVRIPINATRELLNTQGVNNLVVLLKRREDIQEVVNHLLHQFHDERIEIKSWEQLNDFYGNTVALYERQFGVLQLIILILVLLAVANNVNMNVFERVGEFGTMMALGNRSGVVFWLVAAENTLLGLFGGVAGITIGSILAWIISAIGIPMPPPPNSAVGYTAQIQIVLSVLSISFVIGFGGTVLASLFPARQVSRMQVVEALRQNL